MADVLPITDASTGTPPAGPMLIDARRFAELLGVSMATFNRMKAAGKLPRPIVLSAGCHRWRLAEVRDWIEASCSFDADADGALLASPAVRPGGSRREAGQLPAPRRV
jgi:predicted DNA-binding transcriptional regulator AlpA